MLIKLLMLGIAGLLAAPVFAQTALTVRAVSDRPSLLFTEGEKLRVSARVEGGDGAAVVDYAVQETAGPLSIKGNITVKRKGSEAASAVIPLAITTRGHYTLKLTARCGQQTAEQTTTLAVVMKPLPTDINSPWGMFWIPTGAPGSSPDKVPTEIAQNMRLLGASWVRFNFWESVYKASVEHGKVWLDIRDMKRQAAAFRKAGLHIYGEFAQMPKELSSSTSTAETGDAGPFFSRVKPKDYALWDQMVEQIAHEFKNEINVWEVWNEVDMTNVYWSSTPEEYVELVEHTARAIKRGNPKALVAVGGFTSMALVNPEWKARTQRMFELGLGKQIDIFSIHYSDSATTLDAWKEFRKGFGLNQPIWNSEEISVVPLENLKRGIRSFKFLHVDTGYPQYRAMLQKDWSITPAGVGYATAARLIGSKPFESEKNIGPFTVFTFGQEQPVAVIRKNASAPEISKLLDNSTLFEKIAVTATPTSSQTAQVVDMLGRSTPLTNGRATAAFNYSEANPEQYHGIPVSEPCVFVTGVSQITGIKGIAPATGSTAIVAEAEDGRFSSQWQVSDASGWSGGKYLSIFTDSEPDKQGYTVELSFNVAEKGDYELFFSGNALSRLTSPRSLSPFVWQIDEGEEHLADNGLPMSAASGAPEGLSKLGRVALDAGTHRFKLRLTGRRDVPDTHYALWFDAIGLVKVD
ncbi:MAG: GH39 family glycosyl hydrolase [Armatimonadota bacterium]